MRRHALAVAVSVSGCHIVAGYDDLTLRVDPEPRWAVKPAGDGDEAVRVLTTSGSQVFAAGEFDGTIDLGEGSTPPARLGDLFVASYDGAGLPLWSTSFGGGGRDRLRAGVVAGGDLLLFGIFERNLTIAGEVLLGGESETMFLGVFGASDGAFKRATLFDGPDLVVFGEHLALTVDTEGAIIVAGGYTGSADFGCDPPVAAAGALDLFVTKLTPAEGGFSCAWSIVSGDISLQAVEDAGVDLRNDIVIAGEFNGTIRFDDASLSSDGGFDIFVTKLDTDGRHKWSRQFGNASGIQAQARVAVHALGNIAVAALFEGTLDVGGGPMESRDGHDLFVVKLDPDGNYVWHRQFALQRAPCDISECSLDAFDLAVDGQGNLVLTGHFEGAVDFGGTRLASDGATDGFIAKLDVDGNLLWSGRYGDGLPQCTSPDCVALAAVDGDNNVLIGGYFENSADFGTGLFTSSGGKDAFVAKFGP
jgi:hypothetical protein